MKNKIGFRIEPAFELSELANDVNTLGTQSHEEFLSGVDAANKEANAFNEKIFEEIYGLKPSVAIPNALDDIITNVIAKTDETVRVQLTTRMAETEERLHQEERKGLKGILYSSKIFLPSQFNKGYLIKQTIAYEFKEVEKLMRGLERDIFSKGNSDDYQDQKFKIDEDKLVDAFADYRILLGSLSRTYTGFKNLIDKEQEIIKDSYGRSNDDKDHYMNVFEFYSGLVDCYEDLINLKGNVALQRTFKLSESDRLLTNFIRERRESTYSEIETMVSGVKESKDNQIAIALEEAKVMRYGL